MERELEKRINELKTAGVSSAGGEYQSLSLKAMDAIRNETRLSGRKVEIAALENGVIPTRYHRNIGSIGVSGQLKLLKADVAVIGAGGLGGGVIELLARLGIGGITVVDGETFSEDNLNRQLLCTRVNIGKSKAAAAAERVLEINSAVEVTPHQVFLDAENVDSLIGDCDIVIDALDNIPARFLIQEAAGRLELPLVHGAVAGFIGQLMSVFPGEAGLTALFGPEGESPPGGIEVEAGVPAVTPFLIAAGEVMEALKIILGIGRPVAKRLLYFELEEGKVSEINLDQ